MADSKMKAWRLSAGLSLADVSALTGLSTGHLSRAERGEKRLAPLTRVHVARSLGVPVGELFEPEAALQGVPA